MPPSHATMPSARRSSATRAAPTSRSGAKSIRSWATPPAQTKSYPCRLSRSCARGSRCRSASSPASAWIPRDQLAARHRGNGRRLSRERHQARTDVAIKILPDVFAADSSRRARFEREARLLAALNHPHIGAIYGFEDRDNIHGLVLELVEGQTLSERIRQGPVPLTEALSNARQIADALHAAHSKGIVHRDLKPANIALTPEGSVKVLDFGLAKSLALESPDDRADTSVGDSASHGIAGTAAYMSPEQARGAP